MIKTIDAKIKNVFKSDGKPTTTLPGIGHHISFPASAVDYEYVFPPILLCPDGYDWY